MKSHVFIFALVTFACLSSVRASSPVDEFAYTTPQETSGRLDNFLTYLVKDNPTYRGQVIVYGAQNGKVGELEEHLRQLREYFVDFRKFDANRLVITNGGYREEIWIQLWGLPPNVDPVKPTPGFDIRDVTFNGIFRSKKLYKNKH